MPPTGGPQLQWVMIGLVTGAEVFGHLPRAAAGRFVEFMNSDLGDVLAIGRASTEDVEHGSEVPEVVLWLRHVTYVQPWSADAPSHEAALRGTTPVEIVLRTRIAISGGARVPAGIDLRDWLARPAERFLSLVQPELRTPTGQSRPSEGVLINKEHIMLARRITKE